SMGNAKSLRGGTLLMTPLKGADGQVYAIAQGNLLVGGAGASANGSKVQINQLAVGRIANGAIVERAVPAFQADNGVLTLELKSSDYGTA
ncbi:flagellar basal body P-ring protein FlgI, partial [Salmonella enterica]|nr:flagellar basal body P-ring protein FlgI [Salmonella enterica]